MKYEDWIIYEKARVGKKGGKVWQGRRGYFLYWGKLVPISHLSTLKDNPAPDSPRGGHLYNR